MRWIIDPYHCTRDIPGTNFHLIPFPKVEILVGGGGVYTSLPTTSHIPCIEAKRCTFKQNKTCAEAACPVMLLSRPAALLKVIFRTTCFANSVLPVSFEILRWMFQEGT